MSGDQVNNKDFQEQSIPTTQPQANLNQSNNNPKTNMNYTNTEIPSKFKPLSPWAYVGYNLLFSIPLIGFIMMIVFAFDNSNINRRNYARSFFCAMLIGLIIGIIILILALVLGFSTFSLVKESGANIAL